MPDLTITLMQTDLVWEDIEANLAMLEAKVDALSAPTDLIILPEMFSTGFSMSAPDHAESMAGRAVTWLKEKARACGTAIAGSLMIQENGRFFNRLLCCSPDGLLTCYDKKHLFRYAGEEKVYTAGTTLADFHIKQWWVRPLICYDLRFPVWSRNFGPAYDLALYVANWPAKRALHWKALLHARAIENQAYVVGVNRVGVDGNAVVYNGDSRVVGPKGEILADLGDKEDVCTISLDLDALQDYRKNFPAWMDADADLVK